MSDPSSATKASGAGAVLVLVSGVVSVLVLAGAGAYVLSEWVGSWQEPGSRGTPVASAGQPPGPVLPLISVAGFTQMLGALEEETGSTTVVDLTLYPRYAVAVVPVVGGQRGRTRSLYYDGTWRETNLGTSDDVTIDLAQVDARLLVTLSRKARQAVDDADQWYLIVGAPDTMGASIYAYAGNPHGEGGYIAARLDGTVVHRLGW